MGGWLLQLNGTALVFFAGIVIVTLWLLVADLAAAAPMSAVCWDRITGFSKTAIFLVS